MKQLRQLCGTVLIMEAVVIGLAIPVAIVLEHFRHGVAGGVGGGLAVCALVLSGMVGRRAWAGRCGRAPSCRPWSSRQAWSCPPCTFSAPSSPPCGSPASG